MAKDKTAVYQRKRQQIIERTSLALGVPTDEAETLLAAGTRQSFRIRRNQLDALQNITALGWEGRAVAWYPDGYTIDSDKRIVSDSDAAAKGDIYVQNAASWLPPLLLNPQVGDKILDVCAAPGGKAAHVHDLVDGQCELWVNDNSRPRLAKLRANFARLGVRGYKETLHDATRLSRSLPHEYFDKILLDAPCSGEGMMQLDRQKDFEYWSLAQIRRLSSLQKRVISEAWRLLAPGGRLVYSTCTMAPEENEVVVSYALRHLEGAVLQQVVLDVPHRVAAVTTWNDHPLDSRVKDCVRLAPSQAAEAFFVAVFTKQPLDD